jgi:hypothetical protein
VVERGVSLRQRDAELGRTAGMYLVSNPRPAQDPSGLFDDPKGASLLETAQNYDADEDVQPREYEQGG